MTTRARRFEYAAGVDREGRISAAGGPAVELPDGWAPEHLVLAGLARCILASLAYHARRAALAVAAGASASGAITRRESDGRYAFVELEVRIDAQLDPAPSGDDLATLLAKAERDCFVSASLAVAPAFRWRVNGSDYSY